MKIICPQAGILTYIIAKMIDKVYHECGICARSERSTPVQKVSLTHVNEAFNMEVQLDSPYEMDRGAIRTIITIMDIVTRFTEGMLTLRRGMQTIIDCLDSCWIFRHGSPASLSADDEYNRRPLRSTLQTYENMLETRPA